MNAQGAKGKGQGVRNRAARSTQTLGIFTLARRMGYQPTTIESNERGWRDALVVVLLPLSIVLIPIACFLYFVRRSYWLRKRGFWVTRQGRDAIEYQELSDGKVRRLTIGGEMLVKGPHVVYVPTEAEWQQWQPSWAQGRREEIVENVRRALGTKNYEFVSD